MNDDVRALLVNLAAMPFAAMPFAVMPFAVMPLAAMLGACGAAEAAPSTAVRQRPVATAGTPECTLDGPTPIDRQVIVVLEEGMNTDAAARRWLVDTYGVLELDGYASIEAVVPPEHVNGAELARSLRGQLEDSGVLELSDGCYGESSPDGWSSQVTTLVIPHDGRIRRFALVGDEGPLALVRAVRLVRSYARAIALPEDDEAQRAIALTPRSHPPR